jgi:hypothetical protein
MASSAMSRSSSSELSAAGQYSISIRISAPRSVLRLAEAVRYTMLGWRPFCCSILDTLISFSATAALSASGHSIFFNANVRICASSTRYLTKVLQIITGGKGS